MYRHPRNPLALFWLAFAIAIIGTPGAWGQDSVDNRIELLKAWPPTLLQPDAVDLASMQIAWREEQLLQQIEHFREQINVTNVQIDELENRIDSAISGLKTEFRVVDPDARSEVAGRCLEAILDARLEIATLEALSTKSDEFGHLDRLANEIALKQARLAHVQAADKLRDAERILSNSAAALDPDVQAGPDLTNTDASTRAAILDSWERSKQQREQDVQYKRAALEIAELEVAIAESALASPQQADPDMVKQLAAMRARESSAVAFLQELNRTTVTSREVDFLEREITHLQEAKRRFSEQLELLEREVQQGRELMSRARSVQENPGRFRIESDDASDDQP